MTIEDYEECVDSIEGNAIIPMEIGNFLNQIKILTAIYYENGVLDVEIKEKIKELLIDDRNNIDVIEDFCDALYNNLDVKLMN